MEKVYDRLDWNFLKKCFNNFIKKCFNDLGFCGIGPTGSCNAVTTTTFSIIIIVKPDTSFYLKEESVRVTLPQPISLLYALNI